MILNKIIYFKILLTIQTFLLLTIGCATTPSIIKYGEDTFDTKTGVYKNNEIGFQISFPKEYKVYIDEPKLKQMAKREKSDWVPKLRAINEKEYTQILMGIEKTRIGLKQYFEATLSTLPSGMKVISKAEDQISGIKYLGVIISGVNPKKQHLTVHSCCFDLIDYKVHFTFISIPKFYNRLKIEGIIRSFRSDRTPIK